MGIPVRLRVFAITMTGAALTGIGLGRGIQILVVPGIVLGVYGVYLSAVMDRMSYKANHHRYR